MSKTVSTHDNAIQWVALLEDVMDRGDEVFVERHGTPEAVVMPVAAYDELQRLRVWQRRYDALDELVLLEEGIAAHNKDRVEDEGEDIAFADRLSHELIDDMTERGDLSFERDQR